MKGNTLFTYMQLGSGTPEYEVLPRQEFRIAPEEGVFSEAEHLELCRIKGLEGYKLLLWPINQVQETQSELITAGPKTSFHFRGVFSCP